MTKVTYHNSLHLLDTENETEATVSMSYIEPYSWEPEDKKPIPRISIHWNDNRTNEAGSHSVTITLSVDAAKDLSIKLHEAIVNND